jgi:hypothetical protein
MEWSIRRVLMGAGELSERLVVGVVLAVVVFGGTLAGYVSGVFEVAGGVVFVPGHAAIVGLVVAGLLGVRKSGLVLGLSTTYGALLGFKAYHAFFGLPKRAFGEQIAYFVRPDGVVFYAVEAVIIGGIFYTLGVGCSFLVAVVRDGVGSDIAG